MSRLSNPWKQIIDFEITTEQTENVNFLVVVPPLALVKVSMAGHDLTGPLISPVNESKVSHAGCDDAGHRQFAHETTTLRRSGSS
jgi:hypothetical protein